jgi:hypothetical protein
MRTRIVGVVVAISFSITACSTYAPISSSIAPSKSTLRFSLNEEGRAQYFGRLGSQLESIEGVVRERSDSTVTLAATEVARIAADNQALHGESVTIPSRYIARVEQKRTQVGRSLLVAGVITGALFWIGAQMGGGQVTYKNPPGPPVPGK